VTGEDESTAATILKPSAGRALIATQGFAHHPPSFLPSSLDRSQGHPERFCNAGLIRAEIPGHPENLAVLFRQALDRFMKHFPSL
jgi:hypothetical protein